MNPTLREPEMMEIVPCGNRPLRVGDVVFFLPPGSVYPVVHRVVRVMPDGISTRGDNNSREDDFLLRPENIRGRVVAARRGRKRRKVAGGFRGCWTMYRFQLRRLFDRGVSPLLHPLYHALSRRGIAKWLPASFRPRVVVFRVKGEDRQQLLLGERVIGRYDERTRQWRILRPFRLLVNEKTLREWNRTLSCLLPRGTQYGLALADGTFWILAAGNAAAVPVVSRLAEVMRLRVVSPAISSSPGVVRRLIVSVKNQNPEASRLTPYAPLPSEGNGIVQCVLPLRHQNESVYLLAMRLSVFVAREAQTRGGVLLHGALAERDGMGVILAAPGGTGKTTASHRLSAPWRSLCDDTTLVVPDPQGNYRAHPWPTWSRFLFGGSGDGRWDVERAVPLGGIFFLSRATEDRVEPVGAGHAVSLLVECAKQGSMIMARGLGREETRALHLERFDNLCALARVVPAHLLHISQTGVFWREIESAMKMQSARP
jgi:hypothetical protein